MKFWAYDETKYRENYCTFFDTDFKKFRSIWQIQFILCPGRILRLRTRGHFIIIFSLIVFYCQIRDFLILFLTAERLLRALSSFGKRTGPIKVRLFSEISDGPVVPFRFYFSESYATENIICFQSFIIILLPVFQPDFSLVSYMI